MGSIAKSRAERLEPTEDGKESAAPECARARLGLAATAKDPPAVLQAASGVIDWRSRFALEPELATILDDELENGSLERYALLLILIQRATEPAGLALLRTFLRKPHQFGGPVSREQRAKKRDLPRCGARARTNGGAPCKAPVVCRRDAKGEIVLSKRCKLHGGLSTGAKTPEGRARLVEAARTRWERWRAARANEVAK